jgi:hypothetical protein
MIRGMPLFVTGALLACLTCGTSGRETQVASGLMVCLMTEGTCPDQVFRDPNACPVQLDRTKIVTDPHSGKPCLLGYQLVLEGLPWSYYCRYCDPDGDLMTLTATGATLTDHHDGTCTISGLGMTAGAIIYPILSVTDKPLGGDAITRRGTVAVIAVKRNRPPSLCGGLP